MAIESIRELPESTTLPASGGAKNTEAWARALSQRLGDDYERIVRVLRELSDLGVLRTLIDAKGDLLVGTASDTIVRKAVGADGRVLMADSTQTDGLLWSDAAVLRTLIDAKGDILVGTANDTITRKAVGANGQVLTADSAQTDGLLWDYVKAVMQFFSDQNTNVPAGATNFLGYTHSTTEGNVDFRVPFKCLVRNMYTVASNGPSGAETYTYTLRKSGVDTAVTSSCTGATRTSEDTTHEVQYATGDTISIKVVTSAGAVLSNHRVVVELRRIP